jgi:hypothetical protein
MRPQVRYAPHRGAHVNWRPAANSGRAHQTTRQIYYRAVSRGALVLQ